MRVIPADPTHQSAANIAFPTHVALGHSPDLSRPGVLPFVVLFEISAQCGDHLKFVEG
jgi:hypothetical protein